MQRRLAGKTALVIGAGSPAGREIATQLAESGAKVIAAAVDIASLEGLTETGIAETLAMDVTDIASVYATADAVGAPDILVHCDAYVHEGTVLDCDEVAWDYSFDVNVKAVHRSLRAFLPSMKEAGGGTILNLVSADGDGKPSYAFRATTAAVAGLSEAVTEDFSEFGIHCRTISGEGKSPAELGGRTVDLLAGDSPFTAAPARAIEKQLSA